MNRQQSVVVVVLVLVSLGALPLTDGRAFAQGANPFAGTWRLNVAKSRYSPGPAPKSSVVKVEYDGDTRRSVVETVTATGQTIRTHYAARPDGKDYPLNGSPTADTLSLRVIGLTTLERIDKKGGQVIQVITMRLASDFKSMTVTQKGVTAAGGDPVNNTLVWEKQ